MEAWEILMTDEVEQFLDALYETDRETHKLVNQAILVLEHNGPAEGRPLVDTIAGSSLPNLKELRPGSVGKSEIRILFVFDPWRSAILLIAGDKAGQWQRWYRQAIPLAEQLYETYLQERRREMGR
nr:type II toxin-antitoxin system RelE/ParE family toxin [Jiangella rhizosphaerae]